MDRRQVTITHLPFALSVADCAPLLGEDKHVVVGPDTSGMQRVGLLDTSTQVSPCEPSHPVWLAPSAGSTPWPIATQVGVAIGAPTECLHSAPQASLSTHLVGRPGKHS